MMKRTTEPNSTKMSAKGEHKIIYFMLSAISNSSIFLAGCGWHVENTFDRCSGPDKRQRGSSDLLDFSVVLFCTLLQQQPVKSEKRDRGRWCEQFYGALLTLEGIQIVCHFAFDKNMWGQAWRASNRMDCIDFAVLLCLPLCRDDDFSLLLLSWLCLESMSLRD